MTRRAPSDRAVLSTRGRWPFWAVIVVLAVGLAATGVLTWISYSSYNRNENRLLRLRARDVGDLVTSFLPSTQTPLASAAALADATHANRRKFIRLIAPYVGTGPGRPFISASLWRASEPGRPVMVIGAQPELASRDRAPYFLGEASSTSKLSVIGLLDNRHPRLGYAFMGSMGGPFIAYGESALPLSRYVPVQRNSAFSDLDFALYLGRTTRPRQLLVATVRHLPLSGRQTTIRVPFGDTLFTVTVAARGPLGGSLPQQIPWVIAVVGVLLTLGASSLATGLIQRRRNVERLAGQLERTAEENRELYAEQRDIAQTLQRALLPQTLPQPPGLEVSARYEAGVEGVDIGGDWYDLIALRDERLLLVVGDVSGRGLRAATTMASLRFAIRAYSAEGDSPATFLPKLSSLLNVSADRQLATILCAEVDVARRRVSFTNAGHLPPLLITRDAVHYLEYKIGLPIGVERDSAYSPTTVSIPPGATLLMFTDGLVERRGESIDAGLERLRSHVAGDGLPLDDLLGRILHDVRVDTSDDTAIAAIRWMK
jgi:serine phosphatase RsbU (regulator of sigma subunit)